MIGQVSGGGADEQGEEDEWEQLEVDDGLEQVTREEHFDQQVKINGFAGVGGSGGHAGGFLGGAEELVAAGCVEGLARLEDIHDEEAEADSDDHIDGEKGERAGGHGAESGEVAELGDSLGEGGEDEGDDDDEEEAEEDLAEGVEEVFGDPLDGGFGAGLHLAEGITKESDNYAGDEADEDVERAAVGGRGMRLGCSGG
ncbi:MAG: hypothetical protein RI897_177 [Verrucomicrobiota bacterium]